MRSKARSSAGCVRAIENLAPAVICPQIAKIFNQYPPLLIPCVIVIIVNTGMTLRTQVLLVTLGMPSAQIITLNLVFR